MSTTTFDASFDAASRKQHRSDINVASFFVPSQIIFYVLMTLPYSVTLLLLFWKPAVMAIVLLVSVLPALVHWFWTNFRLSQPLHIDTETSEPVKKKVAIIGAGVSGIVSMKELKEIGHKVTCYEKLGDIGGVFYYQPDVGGVWNSAHLTSSPYVTAFSDFPPLEVNHSHWHHAEYCEYLRTYCRKHEIMQHINFNTSVQDVSQRDDGKWIVATKSSEGKESKEVYDAVVIGTGLNQAPNTPKWALPGNNNFKGKIIHSAYYKSEHDFKDKRVLIVGIGETGSDLVREISPIASHCALSIRRGTFVIPRVNPHTQINNDYDTNRLRYSAPIQVRDSLIWWRETISYYMGSLDVESTIRYKFYKNSRAGAMSQFACKSDRFVSCLANKSCELRSTISELTPTGATFEDGSTFDCDVILLCTGFHGEVDFLTMPDKGEVPCMSKMFKKTFVPSVGTSLAFVGFARPSIGAIPPIAELQARYVALILAEQRHLPSQREMVSTTEFDNVNHNFSQDIARPTLVNWIQFMDQMADLIGCRPDPFTLFKDPVLMWQVMVGPMVDAQYRISGPGKNAELARDTIMRLPRGMPLIDLAIWTTWNCTAAVLRTFGVPGLHQWSTVL